MTACRPPNRKEPYKVESGPTGKVPIDRLAEIAPACLIRLARLVDAGRVVTAGGITSGMDVGFRPLRRAGYDEDFVAEVARVMEYSDAYELYRQDWETAAQAPPRLGASVNRMPFQTSSGRPRSMPTA